MDSGDQVAQKCSSTTLPLNLPRTVAVLDGVEPALSLDIERYCAPDQFVLLLLTVRFGRVI